MACFYLANLFYWGSALRIAWVSSATAIRQNSNWDRVCTIPAVSNPCHLSIEHCDLWKIHCLKYHRDYHDDRDRQHHHQPTAALISDVLEGGSDVDFLWTLSNHFSETDNQIGHHNHARKIIKLIPFVDLHEDQRSHLGHPVKDHVDENIRPRSANSVAGDKNVDDNDYDDDRGGVIDDNGDDY